MTARDVERIARDIITRHGLGVSLLRVEPSASGWQIAVRDMAGRVLTHEVPVVPPARVRDVLERWLDDADS